MNCKEYQELTPLEKSRLIGSVAHAIMSHSDFFRAGIKIKELAEEAGLFEGVEIHPEETDKTELLPNIDNGITENN
jgi:hypothetical protein